MVVQTTLLKKASLVGAFFVSVCLQSAAWAFCPLQPELQALRVAKVVDGDTLRLADGRSVRLIGLIFAIAKGSPRAAFFFCRQHA